jgi:predicted transcriptional regulator
MVNYINSKKETSDWIDVSDVEKQGIEEAIVELNEGKALPHEHVIEKMKSKFSYV